MISSDRQAAMASDATAAAVKAHVKSTTDNATSKTSGAYRK